MWVLKEDIIALELHRYTVIYHSSLLKKTQKKTCRLQPSLRDLYHQITKGTEKSSDKGKTLGALLTTPTHACLR